MKKVLTVASIILLLLILLVVGAGWYLSRIDPNNYKGRISQYVYAKTGQVLVINGDMQWSFFPWVGLKANNLTYYNSPNFTPKVFVAAKEMDIKVKLVPLLRRKIEIGNVTLNDATLNLIKNKTGEYNWQSLTNHKKNENLDASKNTTVTNMTIASLKIKNGKLNWYDQQKNSRTKILGLDIASKGIQFHRPFPFTMQLIMLNDNSKKNLTLDMSTDVNLSADYQTFNLENIKVKGDYLINEKAIDFKASGNLATDLKKQLLVSNFSGNFSDVKGQLALKGEHLQSHPDFTGTISIDDFNLKALLGSLGKPINTKESGALKAVSLLGNVVVANNSFQIANMHAKVDNIDLFGKLNLQPKNKVVSFNLTANDINIDDYLTANEDKVSEKESSESNANSRKNSKDASSNSSWKVSGNLKVSSLHTEKFKLKNVTTTLTMLNDVIRFDPLHASLYGGSLDGSVVINKQQKNKTVIAINQTVKNVDIKELLHEFSDADKLSGSTNITTNLTSVITNDTTFLSGLNGTINLVLTNGSLRGIDVIYQLSRAHAFIKRLPSPDINDSKQTDFAALKATAAVKDGVISTEDLALTSDYLKVSGKGSTNLVTKEIKYHLDALAQPKLAAVNNQIGKEITVYQVPIKVSGKLNKPSVNLDFVELAKIFVSKEIQKPISEHVTKNFNNLKDNVKNKVEEKLKQISPTKLLDKLKFTKPANDAPVESRTNEATTTNQ